MRYAAERLDVQQQPLDVVGKVRHYPTKHKSLLDSGGSLVPATTKGQTQANVECVAIKTVGCEHRH